MALLFVYFYRKFELCLSFSFFFFILMPFNTSLSTDTDTHHHFLSSGSLYYGWVLCPLYSFSTTFCILSVLWERNWIRSNMFCMNASLLFHFDNVYWIERRSGLRIQQHILLSSFLHIFLLLRQVCFIWKFYLFLFFFTPLIAFLYIYTCICI